MAASPPMAASPMAASPMPPSNKGVSNNQVNKPHLAVNKPPIPTTMPLRSAITQQLSSGNIGEGLRLIDKNVSAQYQQYFGQSFSNIQPLSQAQIGNLFNGIETSTGTKTGLLYVFLRPKQLDLILITAKGNPIYKSLFLGDSQVLISEINDFRKELTNPRKRNSHEYLETAKKLHEWLITPIEADLKELKIDTIMFTLDEGLRGLPIAALYDGKQFLVEKYNLVMIPSINLIDTRYVGIKNARVLAMGASQFEKSTNLGPLPAVPLELSTIIKEWSGVDFLNQRFTLENLKEQRQKQPFAILHLATHGIFQAGDPNNSFIQLWNSRLLLNKIRELKLYDPPVELLVLSACRTALGDKDAELGFGGLAVQAGVKTALASLWSVSDEGTLALMTQFYHQLKTAPIKAAALRQAQISMLRGEVRIEGGTLRGLSRGDSVTLPENLRTLNNTTFVHPY
jgi:CHAT domain-containing protein